MFSKAERRLLETWANGEEPDITDNYGRVLLYRIQQKLDQCMLDLAVFEQACKTHHTWFNVFEPPRFHFKDLII